jgi:uncharacterized SAM-binding protein YcdF (DUF218 family)
VAEIKSMRGQVKRRWLRIVILLAIAWPVAAFVAAKSLIVRSQASNADAIVVLAGSSTYVERTQHAAQLLNQGLAPRIILTNDNIRSGWSVEEQRNPLFVERAANELKRQGVPADKIEIVPVSVSSTHDEALRIRDYTRERGWHSILVVTSAYQARRALWTLRRAFAGTDVSIGLDAAAPGQQSPRPAIWWLDRLGWKLVAGEYVKMIYYRMKY